MVLRRHTGISLKKMTYEKVGKKVYAHINTNPKDIFNGIIFSQKYATYHSEEFNRQEPTVH